MPSDSTCLQLLWALADRELSAKELAGRVSKLGPAVSQHLAKLRMARLVRTRREGTQVFYRLENDHVRQLLTDAADPIVGLVIAGAIAVMLVFAARDVFGRLLDRVDPDLVDNAVTVLAARPGVRAVRRVRMRRVGHQLEADAELDVDPSLSLADAHTIAHGAEHELAQRIRKLGSGARLSGPRRRAQQLNASPTCGIGADGFRHPNVSTPASLNRAAD
jgi:DNA-binding transcriptional ArsR family regulator